MTPETQQCLSGICPSQLCDVMFFLSVYRAICQHDEAQFNEDANECPASTQCRSLHH